MTMGYQSVMTAPCTWPISKQTNKQKKMTQGQSLGLAPGTENEPQGWEWWAVIRKEPGAERGVQEILPWAPWIWCTHVGCLGYYVTCVR